MRQRPLETGCLFAIVAFLVSVGLGILIVTVLVPAVKGERPADVTPTARVIVLAPTSTTEGMAASPSPTVPTSTPTPEPTEALPAVTSTRVPTETPSATPTPAPPTATPDISKRVERG